jgi:hypothetical protein
VIDRSPNLISDPNPTPCTTRIPEWPFARIIASSFNESRSDDRKRNNEDPKESREQWFAPYWRTPLQEEEMICLVCYRDGPKCATEISNLRDGGLEGACCCLPVYGTVFSPEKVGGEGYALKKVGYEEV